MLCRAKHRGFISMGGIGRRHMGLQRPAWPPLKTLFSARQEAGAPATAPRSASTSMKIRLTSGYGPVMRSSMR